MTKDKESDKAATGGGQLKLNRLNIMMANFYTDLRRSTPIILKKDSAKQASAATLRQAQGDSFRTAIIPQANGEGFPLGDHSKKPR